MKSSFRVLLFSLILFFTGTTFSQSIQVDDSYTAQQLVQDVLVNTTCASISNVTVSGGNFGGPQSFGYFNQATSSFPFANGIVLSTGRAASAVGPNSSLLSEGSTDWPGDNDLEQALNISNSINATILEFDFTPVTNKISFDYIFSSEQYLTNPSANQCNYTDGFAFLLKEKNSTDQYQNLAIIPGTSIPVKVNTVRGSGTICPPANEQYFAGFNSPNDPNLPTNFNGQTVIMKAQADVVSGTVYHIKLVIADQGNNLYDSAIFLGGGSFQSATDLGVDRLVSTNNPYCNGENVTLNAIQPGTNTYKWFKDGVDTGITTPTYTITDNTNTAIVNYSVEVTINGSCLSTGEIKIQFADLLVLADRTLVQCDDNNDGISTFDLSNLYTETAITFHETLVNAQNNLSPISNTTAYQNTITNTLYARITDAFGCFDTATVTLQIANNPIQPQPDVKACDEDGTFDGITNLILPAQLIGVPPTSTIAYYTTSQNAINQTDAITSPYRNTTPNQQIIYARVINGPDCYGIVPITLVVNTFNPSNFENETIHLCDGNSATLSVAATFSSYDWSNGDADFETDINSAGTYTVTVTDINNCTATKTFIAHSSGPATNIDAQVTEFTGNNNTILITFTDHGGDYVFSIDGTNYQESNYFTNVPAGEYTIYVKDNNGCQPTPSKTIYILDYPKYFTPNGDGIHDTWAIKNIKTRPNSTINIFDRFGKLLKQFDSSSNGWNGTFAGKNLPAGDYWFTLTLFNGNTVKSHFTLKR